MLTHSPIICDLNIECCVSFTISRLTTLSHPFIIPSLRLRSQHAQPPPSLKRLTRHENHFATNYMSTISSSF